jgi:hypothetical protein
VSLLELQLQELDEQASSREQGAQAIQAELIKLSSELAAQNVAASQLEAEALDADHWRDKLRHDGILARAIGAELADPDSEVLPASLARFIHREQSQLLDAELALARLEETASSIRDVGLAGHDPDVSRVVRQLADAGVITAKAYPAYLADVLPEEDAAKAVVMSNPGRFLGVMVPNVAQLQRAQEALLTAPSVSKPVMVSLATRDPEEPQGDRFVVPPENGSLFNKEAAKAFAAKLQDRIDHARGKRDSLRDYLHVARESESALRQYQARLGQGRFALLQDNAQRARAACQALAERKLQAQRQQEQARAEAKELREAEKREARRLASLHTQLRQVRDYLREFESQLTEWQARAAEAQAALARSLEELADLKRRKIELDSIRLHQRDVELALRAEVVELHAEKARLPAVEPMDPGLLPLHALRSGYETAKDSLRKVEEEKTGHLAVQRDSLQREFPGLRIKYQSMAAGLEERRIRAHLGVAYREAIGRENAVCSEARARQAQAATAKGAAGQALDAFRRQRKYPQHAVLGAEDQSDTALAVSYQDSDQRVRRADEAEKAARQQEQAGRDKARDLKQAADTFANQNATLRELVTMVELPAPDPALFRTAQGLGEACARMTRALKEADTRKEKAETNARRAHDKVLRIVTDAEFLKVDADLAVTLKSNPIEAAIRDHARIEHAIEDRMAAVVSELATMEQDFERATEALHGLASTAITLLRRAAEDMRLPDNVPVVGGLTVVKMSRALFTLTHEARRARLRPYMEELAADGNIPESGAALATQAVLRLADGRLGIRILKMVDVADEQYVPVDGLSHSGAERISMALLLYFVIAKLRYEARAKTRKAQGGVLMLDNPFAKATARPIWQAILSLADTMDVQLVIATGIKEYDTLSVFRRFLRLAKTERNATTGRTHVSVADFNFRPNMNTEAA